MSGYKQGMKILDSSLKIGAFLGTGKGKPSNSGCMVVVGFFIIVAVSAITIISL